ncbi:MAG: CAP domain-containing protein [Candidatus Paceibacterota bacterium]
MKKPVEDYLIPHEDNDNKPHIMRSSSLLLLFLVVLIVFASSVFETSRIRGNGQFIAAVLPGVLASLTNDDRTDYGLSALETSPLLERAAQLKANDMVNRGYFDHVSPDGVTPWVWFGSVGYTFIHAGENLAINFTESADVVDAWMNSEGHRTNILDPNFTQTGIATAVGTYKGKEAIFVVQLFGAPAFVERAPVSEAVVETPEENSVLLSSAEIEEDEDVQTAEAQGIVQSAESSPKEEVPDSSLEEETVSISDSVEDGTIERPLPRETAEPQIIPDDPSVEEELTQGEAPERPSGFLRWFSLHPTFIIQFVYAVIGGFLLFSLGLMVYRAAHEHHSRSMVAGVLLIVLMVVLAYIMYRYSLPMQFLHISKG